MCGILGYLAGEGPPPEIASLIRLTNLLAHRGPDGGGYYADDRVFLGHRRLAIIDLVSGNQPMASADGRLIITFDGEIYNHLELQQELAGQGHRFETGSDTEVLLHGYRQWGEQLPSRLIGMFAFGLFDREQGSLFLARDRFGEKPLFWTEQGGALMFASELRPIAAWLDGRGGVDDQALADYLVLNYVPYDRTLLRGVRRVPPGGFRMIGRQGTRAGVYFTPGAPAVVPPELGEREPALAEVRTRLDDAVRLALRSDVPVSLFLSGGLDSSLVAESAVRQGKLRDAYCLDFPDRAFSEWDNAKFVADRLGLQLHRVLLQPEIVDDLPSLVDHADDPLADSSMAAVWTIARAAARDYKVVLSGDGGDELFGGYVTYKATRLHAATVARLPMPVRRLLAGAAARVPAGRGKVTAGYKLRRFLRAAALPAGEAHFTWNGSFLPDQAASLLAGAESQSFAVSAARRLAAHENLSGRPALQALQAADARQYLANDILVKVDRMTMAHGLESRAPLLNQRLADIAFPLTSLHGGGLLSAPKPLLRALADRIFGPRISQARKQGFSIPVHDWLSGRGRPLVEDLLSPRSLADVGQLDVAAVSAVRERFLERKEPLGFEVWGLLVLVAWHRARIQFPRRGLDGVAATLPRVELRAAPAGKEQAS